MSFDANGLTVKREPEFIQDIQDFQDQNIPQKFDYSKNKLIYQLNAVYSKSADEIAKLLEIVYDSIALSKAEGVWLDELALLRGVSRIAALASFTPSQRVKLAPSATIPAGSLWSSDNITQQATNTVSVSSNTAISYETRMLLSSDIDGQPDGLDYTVIVNTDSYTYTSVPSDGLTKVEAGLTALFDADTDKTWSYEFGADPNGRILTITPDPETTISTSSLTSLITTVYTTVFANIELVETGAISVPVGSFNTLATPVIGVFETTNTEEFITGRSQEPDEDLRLRVAQGPVSDCTGTIETIQAALLANVAGVTTALVVENVTDFPNTGVAINPHFPDGIPFGGYETLVVGGTDADVASEIWRTKPAGTPAVGTELVVHTDSSNVDRNVYFSRPTAIHLAFEIEYTRYDEESFPVNGEVEMENTLLAQTNALGLDVDVIPSRYFGPIYNTVSGIDSLIVRVQQVASPGDPIVPGSWQTDRLPIGLAEYASTTAADITIIDSTPP